MDLPTQAKRSWQARQARKEVPEDEIHGFGERFLARKREERDLVDEKKARSLED